MHRWNDATKDTLNSIGLLWLRLSASLMMACGHGYGKLASFNARSASFSDPLGVGSPTSMALAIFGEFICPLLIALGLGTRLAAVPAAITMAVAAFVVHAPHPVFKAAGGGPYKEAAILYLIPFLALFFLGPGRYSLDAVIAPKLIKK